MRLSPLRIMPAALALSLALSLALALAAAGAAAQAPGIAAFYGSFYGAGLAEAAPGEQPPASITRDTDVTIKPLAGGGFTLTWSAESHVAAFQPPKDRKVTVEFRPAGRPNEFEGARPAGAAGPVGAAGGGERYWAKLEGATLTVLAESTGADGRRDTQRWDRTMSGGQMQLVYLRSRDGRPVLTVRATLVRMAP